MMNDYLINIKFSEPISTNKLFLLKNPISKQPKMTKCLMVSLPLASCKQKHALWQ